MPQVNVSMPQEVIVRVRATGRNVSRVATAALADELERRQKVAALDGYLSGLTAEQGPIGDQERVAAEQWVDIAFGPAHDARAA